MIVNERYLQARVGNTAYNLQIYNKAQINRYYYYAKLVIQVDMLYLYGLIECNDKNNNGKSSQIL